MKLLIATFALFAMAAANAGEQKVYKCNGADGAVVFSPIPCGTNAQEMHVEVVKKADTQQSEEAAAPTGVPTGAKPAAPQQSDAVRDISDSVADSDCRRAAKRLYVEPDTTEIDQLKAQANQLENSYYVNSRTGVPNANSQIIQQQDRVRAASIRSTIAIKEQQNSAVRADSQRAVRDALVRCDDQKAEREKARSSAR